MAWPRSSRSLRTARSSRASRPGGLMAGALGAMGVLHFAAPGRFDELIPPELPGSARQWTYGSGVAELAVAGLLATPRTRRVGAAAALALFVAVFPGNVQMVRAFRNQPVWPHQVVAWGRLPLQLPMIAGAWRLYRAEGRRRR